MAAIPMLWSITSVGVNTIPRERSWAGVRYGRLPDRSHRNWAVGVFRLGSGTSAFVLRSANYWVNNPGAPVTVIHRNGPPDISVTLNQPVKPGGWIEVPRQNDLVANGNGLFVGGFVDMVDLNTTKLTFEQFDLTTPAPALKAGDSLSAAQKSRMHRFKLFFEARKVGTIPILASNVREKIVMSNTEYKQQHHPNWGGFTDTERAVVLIDAKELAVTGGGCGKITTDVHALFTSYHPFLGSATVYIEGPTPPPPLPPAVNPADLGGWRDGLTGGRTGLQPGSQPGLRLYPLDTGNAKPDRGIWCIPRSLLRSRRLL